MPPDSSTVLLRLIAIAVYLLAAAGCGVLSTTTKLPPPPTYQTASREALVEAVQKFASIESMRAVVDITLSVEALDRRKETQYRNVRGALVTRRPSFIRTSADTPGGIAKVYDMVSDGESYRVFLPWKNRVYVGSNETTRRSEKRLENVRPQHLIDAFLVEPILDSDVTLLDVETYGRSGYQVLHQVREDGGKLRILRKYWFDRASLDLARMTILDERSEVATDAWYRDWQDENGSPYPRYVRIERPQDGYTLQIEIVRPGLNAEIPDELFELALPEGVEIERVGEEPS